MRKNYQKLILLLLKQKNKFNTLFIVSPKKDYYLNKCINRIKYL